MYGKESRIIVYHSSYDLFALVSSSFSFFSRTEYAVLFPPFALLTFLLHAPSIHSSHTRIIASTRFIARFALFLFIQSLRACCNHSVPLPPTCYIFLRMRLRDGAGYPTFHSRSPIRFSFLGTVSTTPSDCTNPTFRFFIPFFIYIRTTR